MSTEPDLKGAQSDAQAAVANGKSERPERKRRDFPLTLEKVSAPNKAEYDAIVEKLNAGIKAAEQKVVQCTNQLEEKVSTRQSLFLQKKAVLDKLRSIRETKDSLQGEHDGYQDEIMRIDEEKKNRLDALQNLERNLRYRSEDEINKAVAAIEYRISTTTVSLKTEKDLINEIKELNQSRQSVRAYIEAKQHKDEVFTDTRELRSKRDSKKKELKSIRDTEQQHQETFRDFKSKEVDVNKSVETLINDRRTAQQDARTLKEQLSKQQREFQKQERAFERYQAHVLYLKRQEKRAERLAREEEYRMRKAAELEEQGTHHPYEVEMYTCEELIRYLKRIAPKEEELVVDAKDEKVELSRENAFQGKDAVPLHKKNKDADVFGAEFVKKKAPKRKVRGRKNNALTHIPDVFKQFESVKLSPPLDVESIPASLKQLVDKLEYFKTAPPPLTQKEKADHLKKLEKERQQLIVSKDLRKEEMKERAALQKQSRNAEAEEQARRGAVLAEEDGAALAERERSIEFAVKAEDDEKQRRISEELEAEEDTRQAQRAARHASIVAQEREQARRVTEEVDAERNANRETQASRAAARRMSIKLEEEEQLRRVKEAEATRSATEKVVSDERKAAIQNVIAAEEVERSRRIQQEADELRTEQRRLEQERVAARKQIKAAELKEQERRIEEEKIRDQNSAQEEIVERHRRRKSAIQMEEAEQARRIAESAAADELVKEESAERAKRVNEEVEAERRRLVKEFPEMIQKPSIFVTALSETKK